MASGVPAIQSPPEFTNGKRRATLAKAGIELGEEEASFPRPKGSLVSPPYTCRTLPPSNPRDSKRIGIFEKDPATILDWRSISFVLNVNHADNTFVVSPSRFLAPDSYSPVTLALRLPVTPGIGEAPLG